MLTNAYYMPACPLVFPFHLKYGKMKLGEFETELQGLLHDAASIPPDSTRWGERHTHTKKAFSLSAIVLDPGEEGHLYCIGSESIEMRPQHQNMVSGSQRRKHGEVFTNYES